MIMKRDYESRIQKLLSRMTIEEKIGQLQQCGPSLVGAFDVSFEELLNMMFDGRISQEEFGRRFAGRTGGTGCAVKLSPMEGQLFATYVIDI